MRLEEQVVGIIEQAIEELGRSDLYRKPLVAFSDARDPRYEELKDIVGQWVKTPLEFLPAARTVISYFVPFTKEVVLARQRDAQESALWGESYAVINSFFGQVNSRVCAHLQS